MIRVKKVVGESYDLETGQQSQKALMLENAKGATVLIPVSEEDIHAVLELMAADLYPDNGPKAIPPSPSFVGTDTVQATQQDLDNGYYGPDSFGGTDEGSHYDLSATRPASEDDDYDPGEQYGDSSSGLPSI
jgi:hypothetical protein